MSYWKRKSEAEPPEAKPDESPSWFFAGDGDDGRDVSKPVAYSENGNPLYAPRGAACSGSWRIRGINRGARTPIGTARGRLMLSLGAAADERAGPVSVDAGPERNLRHPSHR
jgi:hypothetical protein